MIKVAICEDSDIDREMLKGIVSYLMGDRGLDFEVDIYQNGEELVTNYKNHPYLDLPY